MLKLALHQLSYQIDNQVILDRINLEFRPGETFVIMGPSGCGKSTLLRLIMGLITPSAGRITINGLETSTLSKTDWHQLRRQMGMVFQSSALFDSLNVFENVAFGLQRQAMDSKAIQERVCRSLEIVGLEEEVAAKMPAGLSGGMKKRTAIARAIAMEPPLLLYDEPTTGLDPIIADTINELIRDLQKRLQITSIVVTHDLVSALKVGDRIGLLHQGNLVEIRERDQLKQAQHPLLKEFLKNYQLKL